jgi:transposase InsO family protein
VSVCPFIEAEKRCRRNVKRACELLKVSRAAFYEHLKGPSRRDRADAELTSEIRAVHGEPKGRYGAPQVHAALRRRGHSHGRKRVARLMRQAGLAGPAANGTRLHSTLGYLSPAEFEAAARKGEPGQVA